MCVVSAVGNMWTQANRDKERWIYPPAPQINRSELEALKKDIEELRLLLLAAKRYDEETGQPNCEQEDKVALIKAVAKAVGVSMDDVFK